MNFIDELQSSPRAKKAIKSVNKDVINASVYVTKISLEMECNDHIKKYVFADENICDLSTSIINLSNKYSEYHLVLSVTNEVTGEHKICPLAKGLANTYIQALDLLYDEYKSSPLSD